MILDKDEAAWGKFLRAGIGIYVFVLVLAMFPFSDDPTGDIKNLVTSWASLILAGTWLAGTWRTKQPVRRPPLFLVILLVFLALNLAACLRSSFVGNSLVDLRRLWALFLLYLIASQAYRTPQQVRNLMFVVCMAVAISSIYAFRQRAGWDPFPWSDRTRDEYVNLPGTFGNPNYAAHTLILATIMAVYLAAKRRSLWGLGFAVLFLIHLRFTQQRAGIIALAGALALVVVARLIYRRVRRPVAATAWALIVVAVLGVAGLGAAMGVTKIRTGMPYPLDLSLLIRYKSYCSAAAMALERPLLGWGPGNYKIEYAQFWTPYEQNYFAREQKINQHVHNDVLETGIDAGLPAAGLYLAFLVFGMSFGLLAAFTRSDPMQRRLGYAFAGFFCAFLIDGLFGFNLHVPVSAALLFLMAGALEGLWMVSAPGPSTHRFSGLSYAWRAAAMVAIVWCALADTGVFASQCLLHSGTAALARNDYDRAGVLLGRGERLAPWNAAFAHRRGVARLAKEDWAAARVHLERALEKDPYSIPALLALARSKMSLGLSLLAQDPPQTPEAAQEFDDATRYAERALALCPVFPMADDLLGRIASGRAMALAKQQPEAEDQQALTQAWQQAEAHFVRAIQNGAANTSQLYRQLSQIRFALNDTAGAEDALARSIQADPSVETNWPFFAGFARKSGRYDQFRNTLKWQIQRLNETSPPDDAALAAAYRWLARAEKEGFDNDRAAEAAYRNAVHHDPTGPRTWHAFARFASAAGRLESFKTCLCDTTARLVAQKKTPLPHVAALAEVWTRGPKTLPRATASLVTVVQQGGAGRLPTAKLDMLWAVELLHKETEAATLPNAEPKLGATAAAVTLLHLGIVHAGMHDLQRADELLARAMPKLPLAYQAVCARHRSRVLMGLERAPEALALLQDVAAKVPDNLELKRVLAQAFAEAGQVGKARRAYQVLLKAPKLDDKARKAIQAELDAL